VARAAPIERDVLTRARSGDRDGLARILEAHGGAVYALCRRLAPDPEDCYQEIWEKVFGALPRFEPDGGASLSTWILTIAHRHLVDRHRRRRVRGVVVPFEDARDERAGPHEHVCDAQRRVRLERALGRLSDEHRRVVVLHHIHDLPLEAIAEGEGIAVGTVKSRLHRARAELAHLLGERP
jgi:RNA polymerase sigma-70 factor (ECF subfamily)